MNDTPFQQGEDTLLIVVNRAIRELYRDVAEDAGYARVLEADCRAACPLALEAQRNLHFA